jgi:hypothetical protein
MELEPRKKPLNLKPNQLLFLKFHEKKWANRLQKNLKQIVAKRNILRGNLAVFAILIHFVARIELG